LDLRRWRWRPAAPALAAGPNLLFSVPLVLDQPGAVAVTHTLRELPNMVSL
jgi:hypothetical protein